MNLANGVTISHYRSSLLAYMLDPLRKRKQIQKSLAGSTSTGRWLMVSYVRMGAGFVLWLLCITEAYLQNSATMEAWQVAEC